MASEFKLVASITNVAMSLDAPKSPILLICGGGGRGQEEGKLQSIDLRYQFFIGRANSSEEATSCNL